MFLFDVAKKTRDKTYPETIPLSQASGPSLANWARTIYNKLTGQTDACVIVVKTNGVDSGTILVNGAPKGSITSGVGQVGGLTEGRYKIAVEAKDYHRWEKSDITCTAGQTTTVPAELERMETGGTVGGNAPGNGGGTDLGHSGSTSQTGSHKAVWRDVAIGGIVGGLARAVVSGCGATPRRGSTATAPTTGRWPARMAIRSPVFPPTATAPNQESQRATRRHRRLAAKIGGTRRSAPACTGYTMTEVGGVLTGAFAVAAIVGVVMYARSGDDDDEKPVNVTGQRHKRRPPFAVVPVASPDGAGVTFSMTW